MNNIEHWETEGRNLMIYMGYQKGEEKFWNQQRTDALEWALITSLQITLTTAGLYGLLISLS